jgi:ATP-dependent Lon protease
MNAVSDYGLDSIAALTCIASTINTLRNPTVSPRGIIKIATMLLSGGYLATKYKELIINTFFLDWRLQAGAVPAKNIPGIKKYFRKLETTAEREAFLQDLKNFPFHSPEQFPEQDMLSVAAELQKNPALFQANISQIVNTLSLNQKVLPLEKKTLVLSCPKSHPAVKIAKEIAHALGKPYAVIDFAKNQWRNSLLGRTDMGRGEPGRLFKAFTQTKTPSCVLIFKNTHNLSEEEAFTLINCLTQKDSPVIDRNTDIEIPFKHATTIFINEKNHLSANFFFKYDAFFTNILFNDYVLDERRQIIEKNIIPSIIKKYSLEEPVIKTLLEHATGLALAWQNSNQSFKCCKTAIRKLTFGLFINPPETPLSQDQLTSFFKEYEILEDALTPEIPERLQQSIKIKMSDAIANGNLYKYYIEQYPFRKELIPFIRREAISHAFEEKIVGLEAKKQEVLTLLISNTLSAPIHKKGICFVGMAGTGKTNFAHALADATERKKYVIDFNSMANLPGDPTNIAGAEPSDFFKAFCQTQSRAPAIILDNIDKASKLNMVFLEKALNPTKNHAYLDQFSGFEMDLSNVFFILTAKDLSEIPSSMLEHLEIINLSGYSFNEKMEIAALSLLPNALQGRAISIAQLEAAYRDIVSCISSLCNLIAPNEKGLHQISRAINSLVLQEVVSLVANNKPLGLTPENLSSFIPPVLSEHTLNPADDINAYCNDVIRSLKITPEEFKKIENHIIALKPWKGGNSITLLYMEWIRKFPFNTYAPEQKSLEFARQQLDSTHFGLEQVKNLILDHLAGSFLATEKGVSKNICFIGGPGIGKTTFAESIAKALNRPFVRVPVESIKSLTGVVGEHEMFGEGPGALGKAVCNTGCLNPVILLDEIDKACPNVQYQLLEILDPAQNKNIKDGFLGLDIDASKILFIASANDLSNLSHALRDRLHKVELSPYGKAERVGIAQHMIVPDILKEFHFPPEVAGYLYELVDELVETTLKTEYGVRNLKRFLYIAANKYARLIIEQKPLIKLSVIDILKDQYPDLLQFKNNPATIPATTPVIGVVNGMYAGGADGGGIHKTQASIIPGGSGNLIKNELGGQTAQASQQQTLMFVKSFASKYNIDPEIFKNADFAIVKQHYDEFDGPSAGIAQTVALISALTKRAVKPGYAVTGAIDALGNLLPVGGYREKILGTTRTGITNFIVPECARETMEALKSQFVGLNIILVKTIDEVLDILLEK